MEVGGCRLLRVGATLRDEKQQTAVCCRRLDGSEGTLATDEQWHRDVRKNDNVAER
jgi:hypothetical protein